MKVLILKYALCLRARFAWLLTAFAAWLAAICREAVSQGREFLPAADD